MKAILTYIFILLITSGYSQNPFDRVRLHLAEYNSVALLDSCSDKNYFNDSVLFYRTIIHLKKGEYSMAKKKMKELAKKYPDFNEVHYLNGLLLFSEENYAKSVTEFNLTLQANPSNIKALYNRSVAFGLMEEYLSAIEDLDACIKLKPDYVLAYYSRAYWYEFTGNYIEAAKDYENTIKLDPRNYDAYFGMAYSFQNLGENTKACDVLTDAVKEGSQIAMELKELFCK